MLGTRHLRDGRSRPGSDPALEEVVVSLGSERRGVAGIGVGNRQRVADAEVEEDRGGDDRHRPNAGREPDPALGEAAHDAVGGREPEGRATGEADRVDPLDEGGRAEEIGLARARRRASHVDARDRTRVRREDDRAAGQPGRIGPVTDPQAGNVAQREVLRHRPILAVGPRSAIMGAA